MREMQLRMQVLQAARRLSRAVRVEPCHWSEGCVGVSLQEMRATMQVMLGLSLRARWDATLVIIIIITRVASHLARSDNPSITCIGARLSCSDTTKYPSDQWQGSTRAAGERPLAGRRIFARSLISCILNAP